MWKYYYSNHTQGPNPHLYHWFARVDQPDFVPNEHGFLPQNVQSIADNMVNYKRQYTILPRAPGEGGRKSNQTRRRRGRHGGKRTLSRT